MFGQLAAAIVVAASLLPPLFDFLPFVFTLSIHNLFDLLLYLARVLDV